ncbi:hypothetical protein EBI01_10625 [Marinomonas rhizomae]|uniref:Uncharacterized protein n=1 Tax=Marinomonas rhizomae TaxID=491948 RepID=A0A366J4J3_9GAMM|nr:hypothetical protein [Marinomonas rhizomae]RBP81777.1 hypothetical protein DFP80_10977 [Marinomonas rhizomae]RNF72900.1 hypothetical protein EBI01_10625 [Marinomonas rhizomae]
MNTPHSPFGVPRKELINSVQKGVVALLFLLLLAFTGMYMLMSTNLEKQNAHQEKLSGLIGLVHSAEEHWLQWLLADDRRVFDNEGGEEASSSNFYQVLVSEYQLIDGHLKDFKLTSSVDVSDSLVFLDSLLQKEQGSFSLTDEERRAAYSSFEHLESLDDELLQIRVGLDYERKLFVERLIWVPVCIFFILATIIVILTVRFSRQLRSGFSSLHGILDHSKRGHVSAFQSRNVIDEFTDLGHLVDNELTSRDHDLDQQRENLDLIEKALAQVTEPFFVTNGQGDIAWLSAGAEQLWFRNTPFFESLFGIDSGLDDPIDERVADSILFSEQDLQLDLSDGVYWLSVHCFVSESDEESETLQRLISIQTKAEMAEFNILHNSLKLLEQDVWNSPIRLLRQDSPYADFAKSLESMRRRVVMLFERLNSSSIQTHSLEKITKLQQIASLIDEKTDHNERSVNDLAVANEFPFEEFGADLNDVALLSEQVRDSLILGYELVLQRLALVEKDLSSDIFLLGDVDRCLNEVRAGVLASLAATEEESEKVRHRFAVDVEYDISKVQEQIEGMKSMAASTLSLLESDRSVGVARLDRARESISEMLERVHSLMSKTTLNIVDNAGDDVSIKISNDERNES